MPSRTQTAGPPNEACAWNSVSPETGADVDAPPATTVADHPSLHRTGEQLDHLGRRLVPEPRVE